MTVNIFIEEDGKTTNWEDLSASEKKRVSAQINDQALTAIGYRRKVTSAGADSLRHK